MLKHKTSVLFVNDDGKDSKTVQIPTNILLNWKKYLITIVAVFAALGLVIGFFIYEHTSNHYTTIYKEKLARANQIKNAIDIEKAQKSFESINQSMEKINGFLETRGLAELKLENAGGPIEFEVTDINDIADFYAQDIQRLEEVVKTTPIGKPHFGEQTSGFGVRHNPFGGGGVEGHKGIDFRGPVGAPIKTTADGKVVFAGVRGGYGNCVIVQHPNEFQTLYAHLSKISVKEGQMISLGDVVGELGSTGRSTGPHLHYEIIKNNEKIDPQDYLNL